jgi:4-diphosphocytidyl-2C-methyl-D-erythritol kinase
MPDVVRDAHAKVNLLLSVGAALPVGDPHAGFHPICSWFHAIDLADEVRVRPLAAGQISQHEVRWAEDAMRATPIDWPLEADLGVRAHRAMEAHMGRALPAAITIVKRIPVGAGLGGGSSDAGAVLLALREACGLEVEDEELARIGATLGSDVGFFLDGSAAAGAPSPALVEDLGRVEARTGSLAGRELVLVVPPFPCATPAVYAAYDTVREREAQDAQLERQLRGVQGQALGGGGGGKERLTSPRVQLVTGRIDKMLAAGRLDPALLMNDLAKPAFEVEPRLGQLVTALSNACRSQAQVTGSGSGVLVVVEPTRREKTLERVEAIVAKLAAGHADGDATPFAGTAVRVVTLVGGA